MSKVFITGTGIMSSLGNTPELMFEALLANETGVRAFPEWRQFNGLNSFLGAPAKAYDEKVIPRIARRSMSRMSEMAVLATKAALAESKLPILKENRRGVMILGSTTGSPEAMESYFKKLFEKGGPEGQLATGFFKVMNHSVAANVAVGLELAIPLLSPSSACSSSSQAIALGWELIQSGLYDYVIAGGADELHYTSTAIFDIVMAASRGFNDQPDLTPKPFDKNRDGLVVSEGASVVILESEAFARKREAKLLVELNAGAYLCDGIHMSQPQAESMQETMQMALERAGISASEIDYINAHATGTQVGDFEEAKASASLFGSQTPISSLKGHFGHSLAACGGIEAIAAIQMIHRKIMIPTRNLTEIDPNFPSLRLLQNVEEKALKHVLSNNFAFGGMNTSLVLSRVD